LARGEATARHRQIGCPTRRTPLHHGHFFVATFDTAPSRDLFLQTLQRQGCYRNWWTLCFRVVRFGALLLSRSNATEANQHASTKSIRAPINATVQTASIPDSTRVLGHTTVSNPYARSGRDGHSLSQVLRGCRDLRTHVRQHLTTKILNF
jgi:hypothetical protein